MYYLALSGLFTLLFWAQGAKRAHLNMVATMRVLIAVTVAALFMSDSVDIEKIGSGRKSSFLHGLAMQPSISQVFLACGPRFICSLGQRYWR